MDDITEYYDITVFVPEEDCDLGEVVKGILLNSDFVRRANGGETCKVQTMDNVIFTEGGAVAQALDGALQKSVVVICIITSALERGSNSDAVFQFLQMLTEWVEAHGKDCIQLVPVYVPKKPDRATYLRLPSYIRTLLSINCDPKKPTSFEEKIALVLRKRETRKRKQELKDLTKLNLDREANERREQKRLYNERLRSMNTTHNEKMHQLEASFENLRTNGSDEPCSHIPSAGTSGSPVMSGANRFPDNSYFDRAASSLAAETLVKSPVDGPEISLANLRLFHPPGMNQENNIIQVDLGSISLSPSTSGAGVGLVPRHSTKSSKMTPCEAHVDGQIEHDTRDEACSTCSDILGGSHKAASTSESKIEASAKITPEDSENTSNRRAVDVSKQSDPYTVVDISRCRILNENDASGGQATHPNMESLPNSTADSAAPDVEPESQTACTETSVQTSSFVHSGADHSMNESSIQHVQEALRDAASPGVQNPQFAGSDAEENRDSGLPHSDMFITQTEESLSSGTTFRGIASKYDK